MPSANYDLRYLQAGVPQLESYLLSSEIYWPLGAQAQAGEPPYPRLTLGTLLLAQARLRGRDLSDTQHSDLARLDEQLDEIRSHWRVAWGQKAGNEYLARLNLWRNYLNEYRDEPENNADRYDYEVQRRVMLDLLGQEAEGVPASQAELLRGMDNMLRSVFVPGPFIWEAALENSFPRSEFWYLYGRPKKQE